MGWVAAQGHVAADTTTGHGTCGHVLAATAETIACMCHPGFSRPSLCLMTRLRVARARVRRVVCAVSGGCADAGTRSQH